MEQVDVVIIGAGSGGEGLASSLAERGLDVVVAEEHRVGGECPFVACMPSKAMIHGAVAGLDWDAAVEHRDAITNHRDDERHAESLRDAGVTLLRDRAALTAADRVEIGDRTFLPRHVVIATGAAPVIPPVDVAEGVEPWTSVEAWTTTERPDRLVVIGGGPVGIETAFTYARYGTEVTIVEMEDQLVAGEDPELMAELADRLRAEGVEIRLGATLERVDEDDDGGAVAVVDGDELHTDRVMFAAGKRPRLQGLGLEHLGLDEDEPLDVGRDGRVAGTEDDVEVWAVGDVTGFPAFTHAANALADVVADNLVDDAGRELHVEHLPRCIFTHPPFAAAGTTTEDASAARVTASHRDLARPAADDAEGFLAALSVHRADRRIRGFSACGPNADELVATIAVAIRAGLSVDDLADTVFAFPTYSEVFRLLGRRARVELA